jgi:signal transduction histidine kinase/CheY-like chemotaxis protein
MNLAAYQGLSQDFARAAMPSQDECICWEVVRSKQTRLIGVTDCARLQPCADSLEGFDSHVAIPLRSKDEVLGVMNLGWQSERSFSKREEEFFSSVGNAIGIAVDNALLFEDVQKTKEKLQRLNRKLEEASQIKSEFLANTSHELRTPLNSIIGFLGLSLDGYCSNREEEREFLRNAQQSAKHLLAIINDVLDLAKIEAGRMELELEEVDLRNMFEEVRCLAEVQAQQKGLKLEFVCGDHPSPRVYADSGKLRQVMVNLVGNAIKFTERGKIMVRSTIREERGNVLIEVEDTGAGIPRHLKEKLFEKFRQVDGSSTRRHGGTGLGLTITKNLVEMMGGMIKLESQGEGRGATVSFTVPIYRENESGESAHAQKETCEVQGEERDPLALVVEDDPLFGSYLDELLRAEGFATVLARNVDDAVNLAKDLHPQTILLDFSLPQKMGGEMRDASQLVKILQKDSTTWDAGMIIITGQDPQLVSKKLTTGELDPLPPVLSKPVDRKLLLKTMRSLSIHKREETLVS